MPELHPENNEPLNQVAKRLLKEAGESPDPTSLYLVQLMRWGLDSGNSGLRYELQDRVDQTLDALLGAER